MRISHGQLLLRGKNRQIHPNFEDFLQDRAGLQKNNKNKQTSKHKERPKKTAYYINLHLIPPQTRHLSQKLMGPALSLTTKQATFTNPKNLQYIVVTINTAASPRHILFHKLVYCALH